MAPTLLLVALAAAAPDGYVEIASADGVTAYRQDVDGGEPDFVVEVDLDAARIESVVDPAGSALWRHTLPVFWTDHAPTDAFAMVNAAFFSTAGDPSEPAFGLRTSSGYVHDGYGTNNEYIGQQLTLHIDGSWAHILTADTASLHDVNGAPEQIAALDPFADKGPNNWVARTFAGLIDSDAGGHRTVLFFCSEISTQGYARDELARWGATTTIMLDGGGSTQLRVQGTDLIASSRPVPHALVVLPGREDEPDTDPPDTDPPDPDTDEPDTDEPDTDEPGTDEPDNDSPGCGCASGGASRGWWVLGVSLFARRRR